MKVAIIGANGQLGSDLCKVWTQEEIISLTHQELDVANQQKVSELFGTLRPDIIINTAAYHKVDECEENPEKSFLINGAGSYYVAEAANKVDAVYVFISTDYVFDGQKKTPYVESDCPNPLSVYGASKVAGEQLTRIACPNHFIIRSTGLYGVAASRAKGGNFVDKMIQLSKEKDELRVVNDQVLTPTYTVDLAKKMAELLKTKNYGTYHITSSGYCSWYDFTREIFKLADIKTKLSPTTSDEFKTRAKRPAYSVLENNHLKKIGLKDLRPWQEALKDYLKEKGVIH